MLTKLEITNFKLFDRVEVELAAPVIFIGPNNSGKSSALQALALWSHGVRRWVEKRKAGDVPKERAGVTINRRDLIAVPVPAANLLWRDLHVREGYKENGKQKTKNVLVEIAVEGVDAGSLWEAKLEFDYANEESLYCRSCMGPEGKRLEVPRAAAEVKLAYLPPMSGLVSREDRLDDGSIGVRIGEGRTAEVLRNLCWQVLSRDEQKWRRIVDRMKGLFGAAIEDPRYVQERGEITLAYKTSRNVQLDISAAGRGQQQTLLLLAHLAANPGSVLLLDEPDAHLEVLRQRQIYQVLTETARESGSQIIAASHSEVVLNEAIERDTVVAFVGKPHRIDVHRKAEVKKALIEYGFDHYVQAEETGWVLYLEGSTDLAILRAFAEKLAHPARHALERPFVLYVENQPNKARAHFHALREATPRLAGVGIFDRLDSGASEEGSPRCLTWRKREIENYLCHPGTLLAWAEHAGKLEHGPLFGVEWREVMQRCMDEVATALATLERPDAWGDDVKASDEVLSPLFKKFFAALRLPNLMQKTNFHTLAPHVREDDLDPEITEKLDAISAVAESARSAESPS